MMGGPEADDKSPSAMQLDQEQVQQLPSPAFQEGSICQNSPRCRHCAGGRMHSGGCQMLGVGALSLTPFPEKLLKDSFKEHPSLLIIETNIFQVPPLAVTALSSSHQ